jgi:hypothetical protein
VASALACLDPNIAELSSLVSLHHDVASRDSSDYASNFTTRWHRARTVERCASGHATAAGYKTSAGLVAAPVLTAASSSRPGHTTTTQQLARTASVSTRQQPSAGRRGMSRQAAVSQRVVGASQIEGWASWRWRSAARDTIAAWLRDRAGKGHHDKESEDDRSLPVSKGRPTSKWGFGDRKGRFITPDTHML